MTSLGYTTTTMLVRTVTARRRGGRNLRLFLVLLVLLGQFGHLAALVKELHYGRDGGLDIECGPDELILIESERLAYSAVGPGGGGSGGRGTSSSKSGGVGRCRAESASCSIPYSQASWYCRGKSSCSGMPVERRPLHKRTCGSEFTNCLRVEYQCVKNAALINVCSNTVFESTGDGHLVSPKFPDMYPPRRNCTCTISASGDASTGSDDNDEESSANMRIGVGFFLIRSNDPCRDWLSIQIDGKPADRRCGFLSNVDQFVGKSAVVNFKSDRDEQDMGFWLYFGNTTPGQKVTLRCGKYAFQTSTIAPSTTTTTSTTSTTRPPKTTTVSSTTLADQATVPATVRPNDVVEEVTEDDTDHSKTSSQTNLLSTSDLLDSIEEQPAPEVTLSPLPSKHRNYMSDLAENVLIEQDTVDDTQVDLRQQRKHNQENRFRTPYMSSVLNPDVPIPLDTYNELQRTPLSPSSTSYASETPQENTAFDSVNERMEAKSGSVENEAYESYREAMDSGVAQQGAGPELNDARTAGRQRPKSFNRYGSMRNRRPNQTGLDSSLSTRIHGKFGANNGLRWRTRVTRPGPGVDQSNHTSEGATSKSPIAEIATPTSLSPPSPQSPPTSLSPPSPQSQPTSVQPSSAKNDMSEEEALSFVEHVAAWVDAVVTEQPVLTTTDVTTLVTSIRGQENTTKTSDSIAETFEVISPTTRATTSITLEQASTASGPNGDRSTMIKPEVEGAERDKPQLADILKANLNSFDVDKSDSGNSSDNSGNVDEVRMNELNKHGSELSLISGSSQDVEFNSTMLDRSTQSTTTNYTTSTEGVLRQSSRLGTVNSSEVGPTTKSSSSTVESNVIQSTVTQVDDRGLMYSKVGLDPPMWLPGEPIQWLDEPFEPLQIPDSNQTITDPANLTLIGDGQFKPPIASLSGLTSQLKTGNDVGSRTSDGKRRPEAKELDDSRSSRISELGAVLSPKELEWLLSEAMTVEKQSKGVIPATGQQTAAATVEIFTPSPTPPGASIPAVTTANSDASPESAILSPTELEWLRVAASDAAFGPSTTNQKTTLRGSYSVSDNQTTTVAVPLISIPDMTSQSRALVENGSSSNVIISRSGLPENLTMNHTHGSTSVPMLAPSDDVVVRVSRTETVVDNNEGPKLNVVDQNNSLPLSTKTVDDFNDLHITDSMGRSYAMERQSTQQQQQQHYYQKQQQAYTQTHGSTIPHVSETGGQKFTEADFNVHSAATVDNFTVTRQPMSPMSPISPISPMSLISPISPISPSSLPSPWSTVDDTDIETSRAAVTNRVTLFNHIDAVPVERDLDKDVVIPLFPPTAFSSSPIDSAYQYSNTTRLDNVKVSPSSSSVQPGEYFVDRLKHLGEQSVPTVGDDVIQPETHRSLLESNVIETPTATSETLTSRAVIDDRTRTSIDSSFPSPDRVPLDPVRFGYPSGEAYENFRDRVFSSVQQPDPVLGDFRFPPTQPGMNYKGGAIGEAYSHEKLNFATIDGTTTQKSSVPMQTVVDTGRQTSLAISDTLAANLPEVPAVAGHAAYRSSNGGSADGTSSILGGQNVIWAIIVVGTIGWLVFVAMLGVTIYHKRKRRRDRLFASPRSPTSSIYSDFHLPAIPGMFPGHPSTSSSSPGYTPGSTTARIPAASAVSGSSTTTLRGDSDSLTSAGMYGSLNDVIVGGGGSEHAPQRQAATGKGNSSPSTQAAVAMTPKRSRATSGESSGDRKSKNANPNATTTMMYDILPTPLFDAKNPAAALSVAAELVERSPSWKKANGSGRKSGRRASGGSNGSGVTDFTSSDCGAVPTGWRLHSALSSIVSGRQSTSGQHQAANGASLHGVGSPPPGGGERNESKKDGHNVGHSTREIEATPPGPPNPPPPLPVYSFSLAATSGDQKEHSPKPDKMAELEQRSNTNKRSSERKLSAKQLKSKKNEDK